MDPLNPDHLLQSLPLPCLSDDPHPLPIVPSQRNDVAVRKSQKADREKLRRDRLNEHFVELGKALDPDRPKNDKATILSDTIQMLKDLTSEVNKLKSEYSTLTEESRELTQEKNDLKEEKASLRSDIENLNMQYQHRARTMSPWAAMDHSVVMAGPPSYPFPMQMAMPSAPLPFHPSVSPYPYFANPNPNVIPNSCSTFVPYIPPPSTQVEQLSAQFPTPVMQQGNRSHVSSNIENKKSSGESKNRKSVDSNEVTTDLELKTPGSTVDHDVYSSERKVRKCGMKDNDVVERSCSSSRCSSSRSVQDSSSNSVFGGANGNE